MPIYTIGFWLDITSCTEFFPRGSNFGPFPSTPSHFGDRRLLIIRNAPDSCSLTLHILTVKMKSEIGICQIRNIRNAPSALRMTFKKKKTLAVKSTLYTYMLKVPCVLTPVAQILVRSTVQTILALLDHVSRAHEIEICLSSVRRLCHNYFWA